MSAERKRQYLEEFGDATQFVCNSCTVMQRDRPLEFFFKHGKEMDAFKSDLADVFDDYQQHRDLTQLNAVVLDMFKRRHFMKPVFVYDVNEQNRPTAVKKIIVEVPFFGEMDIPVNSPLHLPA